MRNILAWLAALAAEHELALVLVHHLAKARPGRAIHAGLGSVDFSAGVRSILLAGSEANGASRALVHVKCNLGPLAPALGYRIEPGADADGAARLTWAGVSALTASDLLAAEDSSAKRSAHEKATAFLREQLAAGPVDAKALEDAAEAKGIARRTLWRAKKSLGVVAQKGGFRGTWRWSLPSLASEPLSEEGHEDGHPSVEAPLAPLPPFEECQPTPRVPERRRRVPRESVEEVATLGEPDSLLRGAVQSEAAAASFAPLAGAESAVAAIAAARRKLAAEPEPTAHTMRRPA